MNPEDLLITLREFSFSLLCVYHTIIYILPEDFSYIHEKSSGAEPSEIDVFQTHTQKGEKYAPVYILCVSCQVILGAKRTQAKSCYLQRTNG